MLKEIGRWNRWNQRCLILMLTTFYQLGLPLFFKTRSFTSVFIFVPSWYVLFPIGTCYWCQFRSGIPVNVYRKSSPIILQWTDGSQQIHTFLAGPRQLEHWPWPRQLPAATGRVSACQAALSAGARVPQWANTRNVGHGSHLFTGHRTVCRCGDFDAVMCCFLWWLVGD